jgi:hypothetical protein
MSETVLTTESRSASVKRVHDTQNASDDGNAPEETMAKKACQDSAVERVCTVPIPNHFCTRAFTFGSLNDSLSCMDRIVSVHCAQNATSFEEGLVCDVLKRMAAAMDDFDKAGHHHREMVLTTLLKRCATITMILAESCEGHPECVVPLLKKLVETIASCDVTERIKADVTPLASTFSPSICLTEALQAIVCFVLMTIPHEPVDVISTVVPAVKERATETQVRVMAQAILCSSNTDEKVARDFCKLFIENSFGFMERGIGFHDDLYLCVARALQTRNPVTALSDFSSTLIRSINDVAVKREHHRLEELKLSVYITAAAYHRDPACLDVFTDKGALMFKPGISRHLTGRFAETVDEIYQKVIKKYPPVLRSTAHVVQILPNGTRVPATLASQ